MIVASAGRGLCCFSIKTKSLIARLTPRKQKSKINLCVQWFFNIGNLVKISHEETKTKQEKSVDLYWQYIGNII